MMKINFYKSILFKMHVYVMNMYKLRNTQSIVFQIYRSDSRVLSVLRDICFNNSEMAPDSRVPHCLRSSFLPRNAQPSSSDLFLPKILRLNSPYIDFTYTMLSHLGKLFKIPCFIFDINIDHFLSSLEDILKINTFFILYYHNTNIIDIL